MSMSDTPRTDEAQFGERAGVDFARQLERELNDANQNLEETEMARKTLAGMYESALQSHAATKNLFLPQARRLQRERATALELLKQCLGHLFELQFQIACSNSEEGLSKLIEAVETMLGIQSKEEGNAAATRKLSA